MGRNPTAVLEVEQRDEALVFALHGRIFDMEAQQIEKELVSRIEQGAKLIVLDLADVAFVTSMCLGALMMGHKRAKQLGAVMRVARPQPLVRQILEVTKLVKLFGIYDSVDAAIEAQ